MKNKILGVLYGMAIGDAMGMPPELWSREHFIDSYGKITDFLDGHPDNEISFQYKRGNFTDDTSQALTIVDSLIETDFKPDGKNIAEHIIAWADRENAFNNNILGPTSKQTLELFREGKDASEFSDKALSNGAAMRIAPVGVLFDTNSKNSLCDYVFSVSRITHSSDITIAGACLIAEAVSSILEFEDRDKMIEDVLSVEKYALSLGAETVSASLGYRIRWGVELSKKYEDDDQFLEELYNMMGAGVNTVDSVPCAVVIAYRAFDVKHCALLCANLGGDTDTIGAMATAICGARGVDKIPTDYIELIKKANNVDFENYSKTLAERRGKIK